MTKTLSPRKLGYPLVRDMDTTEIPKIFTEERPDDEFQQVVAAFAADRMNVRRYPTSGVCVLAWGPYSLQLDVGTYSQKLLGEVVDKLRSWNAAKDHDRWMMRWAIYSWMQVKNHETDRFVNVMPQPPVLRAVGRS